MLSIAHCPRCEERVRVPDVEGPAEVRCPWCGEAFELEEVIGRLPPMLELVCLPSVNDVGEQYASAEASGFDIPAAEPENIIRVSGASPFSEPMEFSQRKKRRSSSSRSRGRRRRFRDSPVVGFLKIAGGGIAGILIAMLILQSINRLPDLGFWPFRGPGNRMFSRITKNPASLSPTLENNSSGEPETSSQPAGTLEPEPDETTPELPKPIDLGVADFAKTETEASSDTEEPPRASVEEVTELLNDYIRGGGDDWDVALKMQAKLAAVDVEAAEVKEQLDAFVKRLVDEKELLRKLLEESKSDVDLIRRKPPTAIKPTQLALVGRIIETDAGLAIQTSTAASEALLLENTAGDGDVKNLATVLVIGTIKARDRTPRLSIRYGKSLSKR